MGSRTFLKPSNIPHLLLIHYVRADSCSVVSLASPISLCRCRVFVKVYSRWLMSRIDTRHQPLCTPGWTWSSGRLSHLLPTVFITQSNVCLTWCKWMWRRTRNITSGLRLFSQRSLCEAFSAVTLFNALEHKSLGQSFWIGLMVAHIVNKLECEHCIRPISVVPKWQKSNPVSVCSAWSGSKPEQVIRPVGQVTSGGAPMSEGQGRATVGGPRRALH